MPDDERAPNEEERQRRIEFEFPLLRIRVRSFIRLFDRLGAYKISQIFSWVALVGMPIVAGFGLYLIFRTIQILLTVPEAREVGRELGLQAYISLPGVNPYLPILYGWLAIIIAIVVHEGAHGVIARSIGIRVKSVLLIFFVAIPIAFGVDLDEEQIKKAKIKDFTRIIAAGIGANIIVALICVFGVMIITSGLTPVVDGLYISEVLEGMPAEDAGLLVGDIITMIDNKTITTLNNFTTILEYKSPGDIIQVTVARGEMWRNRSVIPVNLTEHEDKPFLGVSLSELLIEQRLRVYQKLSTKVYSIHFQLPTLGYSRNLIPFSETLHGFYSHPFCGRWYVIANILFWVWYINVNFAIINTLPIYPLDGGRALKNLLTSVLRNKVNETMISRLTYAVTIGMISAMVAMVVLPFVI